MTDYYSNQPRSNPYQQNPYPANNPYQGGQQGNPYQPSTPSSPFPAASYPQSPPSGVPSPNPPAAVAPPSFPASGSFPSYYTGTQPVQEPQKPRSTAKIVLIVAALVLVVTAGVFTSLYLTAEGDHDKAVSTLEDRKAELSDIKKEITSAGEAKSNAEKSNSDLRTQNDSLRPCVDATMYFLWEAPEAELGAAVEKMRQVCK